MITRSCGADGNAESPRARDHEFVLGSGFAFADGRLPGAGSASQPERVAAFIASKASSRSARRSTLPTVLFGRLSRKMT